MGGKKEEGMNGGKREKSGWMKVKEGKQKEQKVNFHPLFHPPSMFPAAWSHNALSRFLYNYGLCSLTHQYTWCMYTLMLLFFNFFVTQ